MPTPGAFETQFDGYFDIQRFGVRHMHVVHIPDITEDIPLVGIFYCILIYIMFPKQVTPMKL
jgi:hypothetical protein